MMISMSHSFSSGVMTNPRPKTMNAINIPDGLIIKESAVKIKKSGDTRSG